MGTGRESRSGLFQHIRALCFMTSFEQYYYLSRPSINGDTVVVLVQQERRAIPITSPTLDIFPPLPVIGVGTVGVYDKGRRVWRVKTKHQVSGRGRESAIRFGEDG